MSLIVENIDYKDFSKLYTDLTEINADGTGNFSGYVFRGEDRADYKLQPSILRDVSLYDTQEQLLKSEISSLICFYRYCNDQGLPIENIHQFQQHYISDKYDLGFGLDEHKFYWLGERVWDLVALAQHYGLKTRFLDWTRDFRIAVYMASMNVLKKTEKDRDDKWVVWAINAKWLQDYAEISSEEVYKTVSSICYSSNEYRKKLVYQVLDDSLPLIFYTPPYKNNPNLQAQKGVLSLWRYNIARNSEKPIEYPDSTYPSDLQVDDYICECMDNFMKMPPLDTPLDKALENYFQTNKMACEDYKEKYSGKHALLCRFTIPSTMAKQAMRQLDLDGYNAAKLMPGYGGAVKAVMEENLYR